MSNATLISWLLAFLAIGFVGGTVTGLRVGRANPSAKALEEHDEAVARELCRLMRAHRRAGRGRPWLPRPRKTSVKRWLSRWPYALIAISGIVVVGSLRLLLGAADWAGLGQWVGGLGAFAAAWAALVIANREVRRDRAKEAERVRAHAYYLKARLMLRTGSGLLSRWSTPAPTPY